MSAVAQTTVYPEARAGRLGRGTADKYNAARVAVNATRFEKRRSPGASRSRSISAGSCGPRSPTAAEPPRQASTYRYPSRAQAFLRSRLSVIDRLSGQLRWPARPFRRRTRRVVNGRGLEPQDELRECPRCLRAPGRPGSRSGPSGLDAVISGRLTGHFLTWRMQHAVDQTFHGVC